MTREEQEAAAERKRRMAAIFGDALPERTRDETSDTWGESSPPKGGAGDEDWLRSQVPPHHG